MSNVADTRFPAKVFAEIRKFEDTDADTEQAIASIRPLVARGVQWDTAQDAYIGALLVQLQMTWCSPTGGGCHYPRPTDSQVARRAIATIASLKSDEPEEVTHRAVAIFEQLASNENRVEDAFVALSWIVRAASTRDPKKIESALCEFRDDYVAIFNAVGGAEHSAEAVRAFKLSAGI